MTKWIASCRHCFVPAQLCCLRRQGPRAVRATQARAVDRPRLQARGNRPG